MKIWKRLSVCMWCMHQLLVIRVGDLTTVINYWITLSQKITDVTDSCLFCALPWADWWYCCTALLLQVMVVVKYLFQFGFFPWNSVYEMTLNEDKPFFPPRILGLEKTDNYIRYDLLQLLVLFFHRSLLMVSQYLQWLQWWLQLTNQ